MFQAGTALESSSGIRSPWYNGCGEKRRGSSERARNGIMENGRAAAGGRGSERERERLREGRAGQGKRLWQTGRLLLSGSLAERCSGQRSAVSGQSFQVSLGHFRARGPTKPTKPTGKVNCPGASQGCAGSGRSSTTATTTVL